MRKISISPKALNRAIGNAKSAYRHTPSMALINAISAFETARNALRNGDTALAQHCVSRGEYFVSEAFEELLAA